MKYNHKFIFVRRVLTEKNPFIVYSKEVSRIVLVENYSKDEYIIIDGLYQGFLISKNAYLKKENVITD